VTAATGIERAELREMASDIARRELAPRAARIDRGEAVLADCWGVIAEVGLDRALLAEEHGGAGLDVHDLLAAVEELAVGDGGVAMSVLLSNAALLALDPGQAEAVSPDARWALVPAHARSEVQIGLDSIDGRIASALGAHGAAGIVLAFGGGGGPPTAIPTDLAGVSLRRDEYQLGLRGAPAAEIRLEHVPLAAGGDGEARARRAMALLRLGTAVIARGIARRAYALALEYARARRQGGVPIIEHDAVASMLGSMVVRHRAAPAIALDSAQALAVKIAETDAAVETTTDAVQVFGGTGYMVDTGVEKLMRDAKYCQLFPEANWVARDELMRVESGARR
jgi:alkylation response protein AidB-like acyl-CoA dehydrogenase